MSVTRIESKVVATNGGGSSSPVASNVTSAVTSGSGSTPFVALSTYYMAASGASDSYDGLSPTFTSGSHGPWASPHHAVNCGDVIIAAPGAYSNTWGSGQTYFGAVSNCPSTTGGIDGTGGIYFAVLLCGGSDLGSSGCSKTSQSPRIATTTSNWAVEGWTVTGGGAATRAFEAYACSSVVHHVAFINDVAYNAAQGYDTNDCGIAGGPNTVGGDYFAVVGSIAQNAAQDNICLAAIDSVGPGQLDTNSGTHVYFYGDFSYANNQGGGTCVASDKEDFMFDTWDYHSVVYQGVIANNVGWQADRMCVQLFWQNTHTPTPQPTMNVNNNTCFENNKATNGENFDAEFNVATTTSGLPWNVSITNNIGYQPLATSPSGGGKVAAFALYSTVASGATFSNTGNVYKANRTNCTFANCNSGFDAQSQGAAGTIGTNTYVNPAFNNTTDLLANWVGAPNCTGFENVTQCMGYNAGTTVLTANTPIYDLTPTAGGTSGKGYQLPGACAANADYPVWLKGVIYLHWDGTNLTEKDGLVTKPCGV